MCRLRKMNKNDRGKVLTQMKSCYAVVLLTLLPFLPLAAGIFDLVPSRSGQVVRINLRDSAGKGAVRDDLVQQFSRYSGLDEKKISREVP